MRKHWKLGGLLIGALALTGCGTFKQISSASDAGSLSIIAADSSEHLIFVRDKPAEKDATAAVTKKGHRITCAMPQPE